MARLTKAHAARQLGISRTTLYKLIDQGHLSATPDGLIDAAELVRVAPLVDTLKERTRASMDTHEQAPVHSSVVDDEHVELFMDAPNEHSWTAERERQWTSTDTSLVDILREQLQRAEAREQAYEARERDYREHIARLTAMLHESQTRYDRLLEAPRATPPTPSSPPAPVPEDDRGAMRRRIVALLREHPEGLTPARIRERLAADKPLGSTIQAMYRDRLLTRLGGGRYGVA